MGNAMELLAPAGGEEQLEYAMRFGADAVYLATERFGMRARATNFPLHDLPRIVDKAHGGNVKVHVTCNAMMFDHDMDAIPEFLEAVDAAGADALIVGDMGVAALMPKHSPNVELHVSTQASIANAEAAKMWHQLGAKRVVAAREASLADIAALKAGMPKGMELEAFAHGAMCMAYSGRCLVSDFLNGRSGVHGNCAQSCRWQYTLLEEQGFGNFVPHDPDRQASWFLNAEDLCMLEHLDDLANVGVDSIKIEGRTKKAYYVACVTNAYRQVLDGASAQQFIRELDCVSHRPYATGFYYGPAHQTDHDLVYLRKTKWAAQVLESAPEGEWWRIKVKCRDKFGIDDRLEALSPGMPVRGVSIKELLYDPHSRTAVLSDKASPDWKPYRDEPYVVEVADHPAECYYALVDQEMHEGDIIRMIAQP